MSQGEPLPVESSRSDSDVRPAFAVYLFIVACGAIAAIRTINGARHQSLYLEPDSWDYICLGQNLRHGHGFATYDCLWSANWPPLVPLLLSLLSFVIRDPIISFAVLSAFAYAGTIWMGGFWMVRHYPAWVAVLTAVFLLGSTSLRTMMESALSEPFFIFLTTAFLVALNRLDLRQRKPVVCLSLLAALCPLTRYIGVVLIPVGCIVVWQQHSEGKGHIGKLLSFAILSLAPLAFWCLVNLRFTNTLMGSRTPSSRSWDINLSAAYDVLTVWCLDSHPLFWTLFGVLIVGGIRKWRQHTISEAGDLPMPMLLFAVFYFLFLVWSASHIAFDPLDNRLLSPIYVPLVLAFFAIIAEAIAAIRRTSLRRAATVLFVAAVVGFALRDNSANLSALETQNREAYSVLNSPTLAYLRNYQTTGQLCSNEPGLCWHMLHRPVRYAPTEDDTPGEGTMFYYIQPGDTIVWLLEMNSDDKTPTAAQVRAHLERWFSLKTLEHCKDGIVFVVTERK